MSHLETAVYRAYHRWMADYCGAFPHRLKGVIFIGCRDLSCKSERTRALRQRGLAVGGLRVCADRASAGSSRSGAGLGRVPAPRPVGGAPYVLDHAALFCRAASIRGRTSFCSALPRTRGAASAIWRRSLGRASWIGIRGLELAYWKRAIAGFPSGWRESTNRRAANLARCLRSR